MATTSFHGPPLHDLTGAPLSLAIHACTALSAHRRHPRSRTDVRCRPVVLFSSTPLRILAIVQSAVSALDRLLSARHPRAVRPFQQLFGGLVLSVHLYLFGRANAGWGGWSSKSIISHRRRRCPSNNANERGGKQRRTSRSSQVTSGLLFRCCWSAEQERVREVQWSRQMQRGMIWIQFLCERWVCGGATTAMGRDRPPRSTLA